MSALKAPLHVLLAFGTRPEAIKMAPVVRSLRKRPTDFKATVVVTAQHREMLDQVMTLFKMSSDHDLNVMQKNQSLDYVVAQVLTKLGPILESEKPDLVLVHGDTVTTFAAALTAFYHKIPVGHVEAGLRSYDKENPFPEESSRLLTDTLCTLHFAPTLRAKKNLLKENTTPDGIYVTGNTVTDALQMVLRENKMPLGDTLQKLQGKKFILLTAHRRENLGEPLSHVFKALKRVVDEQEDIHMIYPVHLNPLVQESATQYLGNHPRLHLIAPVDYAEMVQLLEKCTFVITDSGGIQEEAPSLGKPVLVLRKVTERPEGVEAGTAQIIGMDEHNVYKKVTEVLTNKRVYDRMAKTVNPYGDGKATLRILDAIRYHFGQLKERPSEFSA